MSLPRITFGIIVLNGEPFLRYNLRALYPFAHQIIVAEGASPKAAHVATDDGHSIDTTLATLRQFQAEEDPEQKLVIVTAEDEGHPNGFWPGEKDQQSQAYAKRATGDWLWQIDIDEFYDPEDMQRICRLLLADPDLTCLTFNARHFWGGFDYLVEGGLFINHNFQGEPWGAYRRLFRWKPGYQYLTHRPPTLGDATGRDITSQKKRNLTREPYERPVVMHHYTAVFPHQVLPKGAYYAGLGQTTVREKFERFSATLDQQSAIKIYDHYGTNNWLQRFTGSHPPAIVQLRNDIANGRVAIDLRQTDDIEQILAEPRYQALIATLRRAEWLRERGNIFKRHAWTGSMRLLGRILPAALVRRIPGRIGARLAREQKVGA